MSDEFARLFDALDAPRAVPTRLRNAILREVVDGAVVDDLAAADAPRPLPAATRARLQGALVHGTEQRPIPAPARRRLLRALAGTEQRRRAALIAAAVLVVLGGVATVVTGDGDGPKPTRSSLNASGGASNGAQSDGSGTTDDGELVAEPGTASGGAGGSASGSSARSAVRATVGIRVIAGDGDAEAAFRAFLASDARFAITTGPAPITVNLSDQAIVPGDAVVMESLTVPEARLRAAVFSAASVVERQAHIAARTAFPDEAAGERAVIVTGESEPFSSRIPNAIESVLRARGVATLRVGFDASLPAVLPRASAAFVSLPTDAAREWLRDANDGGYRPTRGIWGVYSLADTALVPVMNPSVRVVSPFILPAPDASPNLRSARAVHGWVTAKLLGAAVSRTGATTASAIRDALAGLRGYDDGFAAPLDFRPGTNSRTPEGIVLRPSNGRLVASGGFARDTTV